MSLTILEHPAKVRAAIRRAEEYAEEHKVPLTAERLASELSMDGEAFRRIIDNGFTPEKEGWQSAVNAIRSANTRAVASVLEHALTKGSGVNMHLMYLKQYAGYDSDLSGMGAVPTVQFCGEGEISP